MKARHPVIREMLRSQPDGVLISDIAKHFGADLKTIRTALRNMPDTYIDRWVKRNGTYAAVWCAVEVPEDCPRPEGKM